LRRWHQVDPERDAIGRGDVDAGQGRSQWSQGRHLRVQGPERHRDQFDIQLPVTVR
jgi:hypothetical protein